MARALKRVGVENGFIPIPAGGHGFDGKAYDPQIVKVLEPVLEFLDKLRKKS